MAFNSYSYLIFLTLVVTLYFILPPKRRNVLLLFASYFFYMCWSAKYALLMLTSTAITFVSGILIDKQNLIEDKLLCQKRKRLFVALSFIMNLSILFVFKYFNFFSENLNLLFSSLGSSLTIQSLNILLPVGISFYTFQALSYTVDVYRGDINATRDFFKYALFVSFFPQLVAGPIERSPHLLRQFDEVHKINYERMKNGVMMICLGLFNKLIIADRLSLFVNGVYNNVSHYSSLSYVLATVFFAFQIYCDFYAYSLIAIGSAKVMGFDLMKNFNRPYFATSIGDFWRRWHISLSTWFKDYLYIPLGGNRKGNARWALNILVVFLVSGLWHGASWTFVIWGLLHGFYQLIGRFTMPMREKIRQLLKINKDSKLLHLGKILFTFLLTCFAWVFFRANSLSDVLLMGGNLFLPWSMAEFRSFVSIVNPADFYFAVGAIFVLILFEAVLAKKDLWLLLQQQNTALRWSVYLVFLFTVILFGIYGETTQFIYFQF